MKTPPLPLHVANTQYENKSQPARVTVLLLLQANRKKSSYHLALADCCIASNTLLTPNNRVSSMATKVGVFHGREDDREAVEC